jgi:peptide/nickel transport system ATP-binding protein
VSHISAPLLQTKNLKKYFKTPAGYLHAVDGVNISIEEGHTLGVVGESGCGKSTLGRTILRLLPATGGEVLWNGGDILKLSASKMKAMRSEMQIIFQDPYASLNPRLSVSQIIAEPLVVNKVYKNRAELSARIAELMETVGISRRFENAYPHEMDGGRRQRVGIARALALRPKFIVCDEPVSALDVSIQAQILNLMMDLQEDIGLTFMFITHDLSVVKHISNQILVMYLGQAVELADSAELFANPLHPYTKALLSAIPVPDPEYRSEERQIIKGELTSPINPKPGCRFAPRCPLCQDACLKKDPALKTVADGHQAACVLY